MPDIFGFNINFTKMVNRLLVGYTIHQAAADLADRVILRSFVMTGVFLHVVQERDKGPKYDPESGLDVKASRFSWWQNERRRTLEPPDCGPIRLSMSAKAEVHIEQRGGQAYVDLRCLDH